jgi:LysM repeat protein
MAFARLTPLTENRNGAVRHIQTSVRHSSGVSPTSARLQHTCSDKPSYGRSIERPYEIVACWEIVMVSHDLRRAKSDGLAPLGRPLRLTRRGRAVVLVLLVLAASLASVVLFTTASRAEQLPSTAPPAVVVQRGDTLWDIAARIMPGRDGHAAVDELRRLNDLRGFVVHEGDVLILPRGQ